MEKDNREYGIDYVRYYIIAVFVLLPLAFHNYYFDISKTKFNVFLWLCEALFAIFILKNLLHYMGDKKEFIEYNKLFFKFSIIDIAMIVFFISILLSCMVSIYKDEVILGSHSRYNGLVLYICYFFVYFIITRSYKRQNIDILDIFLFVSVLVSLWGICDYFNLDILGFKLNIKDEQRHLFVSSIGNINIYASFLSLSLGVGATLFVLNNKKLVRNIIYYISMFIIFLAIITSNSDSGYIAIMALFAFLPIFAFKNKEALSRYIISVITFILGLKLVYFTQIRLNEKVTKLSGVFSFIADNKVINIILPILILIIIFLHLLKNKFDLSAKLEKLGNIHIYLWLTIVFLLVCFVISIFIYCTKNSDKLNLPINIKNYLCFSDTWGTDRGFIWRLGVEAYNSFDWIHKLFGQGPECVYPYMLEHYYEEMIVKTGTAYDSLHNEFLNYLFSIGVVGLVSYIFLIGSAIYTSIKSIKTLSEEKKILVSGLLMAVLLYISQSIVNLCTAIVAPILFLFISVISSIYRREKIVSGDKNVRKRKL